MTDGSVIDKTYSFCFNVDPTLGENTLKRPRMQEFLQEGVNKLWFKRDWPWTQAFTSVTPSTDPNGGNAVAALPQNFLEIGRTGTVEDSLGRPFSWKPVQELKRMGLSGVQTQLLVYSVGGPLQSTADSGPQYTFMVSGGWIGVVFHIYYKMQCPQVVDPGTDSTGTMCYIPAMYQNSFILPYMRFRAFEDMGDPRFQFWKQEYESALTDISNTENQGKDTVDKLGGSGYYGMW